MLNNNNFFNQSIITNDSIQNKLLQYIEGIDIKIIIELINKDIKEKHFNDDTFSGTILTTNCHIKYEYNYIQWNAIYVSDEWAKMKFSRITINQGDITLILVGDKTTLQAKRKAPEKEITLKVQINSKDQTIDIDEHEKIINNLNIKKSKSF